MVKKSFNWIALVAIVALIVAVVAIVFAVRGVGEPSMSPFWSTKAVSYDEYDKCSFQFGARSDFGEETCDSLCKIAPRNKKCGIFGMGLTSSEGGMNIDIIHLFPCSAKIKLFLPEGGQYRCQCCP